MASGSGLRPMAGSATPVGQTPSEAGFLLSRQSFVTCCVSLEIG